MRAWLFRWFGRHAIDELQLTVVRLDGRCDRFRADLERSEALRKSLTSRIVAAHNVAAAANARAERLESALGRLDGRLLETERILAVLAMATGAAHDTAAQVEAEAMARMEVEQRLDKALLNSYRALPAGDQG